MTFLPPFLEGTQITATTYKWDFPVKDRQLLRVNTEPILSDSSPWQLAEEQQQPPQQQQHHHHHHHTQPAATSPSSAVTHSRSQSDALTAPFSAAPGGPGPATTATEPSGEPVTGVQRRETEPLEALVVERKKQPP